MRFVQGPRSVAVVGGGIAGLAAGFFLRTTKEPAPQVTIIESSPQIGGKLRLGEVAGVGVDLGAEALLVRRPEAIELLDAVGLSDEIVHPQPTIAQIFSRGDLHPIPVGQVMGVPADLGALAASGLLSRRGLARVALDFAQPRARLRADAPVGRFLGARLGREVVDRLVEPLLGGVYAGRAANLSLSATMPDLAAALRRHRSVVRAAQSVRANSAAIAGGPVFAGLPGGVGRLPAAVAEASACEIRTGTPVRELRRRPAGWQLVIGSAREPEILEADAVILALPARPASRLLADAVPAAARELAAIDYASVAIVTLAYPRASGYAGGAAHISGILVPPVERRMVKGVTFSSAKWQWVAAADPGTMIARASIGRYGDEADLQRDDDELASVAADELADLAAISDKPIDALVTRWGGGLPQYTVGHIDRVRRARAAMATMPGLAACGAAYDGVGVPACIATARAAADGILRTLGK